MGDASYAARSLAAHTCRRVCTLAAVAVIASACGSSGGAVQPRPTPPAITASTVVSCEPVPRFRLGDIEYENQRFDDVVTMADLGSVVGVVSVYPAALDRCETVVLQDGEGSLPSGTKIYEIVGVDRWVALTASFGNGVYLKYVGRPVA